MRVTITDLVTNVVLFSQQYSDDNKVWGYYTNPTPIVATGDPLRFAFDSVSASGGIDTIGNFLDDADFGVNVNAVPEPATAVSMGIASLFGLITIAARRAPSGGARSPELKS